MSRHSETKEKPKTTEVPVNTRTVGTPGGTYLLYLEDYVHTFIRKLYEDKEKQSQECAVFLYGYEFDEAGRHYLIVSGAAEKESPVTPGEHFFSSCYCIGEAEIVQGKDAEFGLEAVLLNGKRVILDNYYIYYDQNEEMQNYLIEWNLNKQKYRIRNEMDDTVRLGKMAQAYNREEVKVNFLWNVMNVLSLGFVVCVMAYAIISINNYHKMKDMEKTLSYIVTVVSENSNAAELAQTFSVTGDAYSQTQTEQERERPEENQTVADSVEEEQTQYASDCMSIAPMEEMQSDAVSNVEEDAYSNISAGSTEEISGSVSAPVAEETSQGMPDASVVSEETQPIQYYIVQEGDTLRSISFQVYGTYSKVDEICAWNGIENADSILYGQRLLLH